MLYDQDDCKFAVRETSKDDIPLILSLIGEFAEYEKVSYDLRVNKEKLEKHLFGKAPKAEALIGEFEGEAIAFVAFFYTFSTFQGEIGLYIEDLYVRPVFRGKGFGRKILSYLADLAKKRFCKRIEWSMVDWEQKTIDFYERLGAEAMEDQTVYRFSGTALADLTGEKQACSAMQAF